MHDPILLFVCFVIVLSRNVVHILQFQLTDYLWVRFKSMISERGFFKTLFFSKFALPAKSPRNILIAGVFVLILGGSYVVAYLFIPEFYPLLLFVLASDLIAKIAIVLGVLITAPIAKLKRLRTIKRAKELVEKNKPTIIGVTGSFGKSSVKEFTAVVLSQKAKTLQTPKNFNADIGIAQTILSKLKKQHKYFVVEMGAYHKNAIKEDCEITPPKYGILTGLGNQHMDLFGSKEKLIQVKSELIEALPKNGSAYINCDCKGYKKAVAKAKCKVKLYGFTKDSDIKVTKIHRVNGRTFFSIKYEKNSFEVATKLLGNHNVLNLLPAIMLGLDLGIPKVAILSAIAEIKPIKGKLSLHKSESGISVLNDSLNSNENGFLAALDVLATREEHNKLVISRGIVELGIEKSSTYKKILKKLSEMNAKLFTTDSLFKELDNENRVEFVSNEFSALERISNFDEEQVILLLEGRLDPRFIETLGLK